MIKLESTTSGISAKSLLKLVSPAEVGSVMLTTEEARSNASGTWQADATRRRQLLSFITEDGPVQLRGIVPEAEAIEIASAHTVVVEVGVSLKSLPAREAGRVSGTVMALELVRVVEVWTTKEKCAWRAKDSISGNAAKEVDLSPGRIAKAS